MHTTSKYHSQRAFLPTCLGTGPASNKMIRQALQAATDIEELAASLGPSDLWSLCPSRYRCGTPLASTVGEEYYNEKDVEKAKKMIAESGYAGETFLLMNPNDYATITPMGQVLKPLRLLKLHQKLHHQQFLFQFY